MFLILNHHKNEYLANDSILVQKMILLDPNATAYKLKATISGHGHAGPRHCCEWDSKTHTYYINGWELFRWNIWKDCGNNPIYPQGGTWPFDRAGWCPGTKVDEYEFELTPFVSSGDSISIDYGIEPYLDNGEKNGEFRQSHQLFSYGPPNFSNDAEIYDIIIPSNKDKYSRVNPSFSNPIIMIKNTGINNLKSLEINYGINNRKKSKYVWYGDLDFLEMEKVTLPPIHWRGLENNQEFVVEIKNPNSIKDEYTDNNKLSSIVKLPMVFPRNFILKIKTNNRSRARENSFTISNNLGRVFYNETSFLDSMEYNYGIELARGIYEFIFRDNIEDGVSIHWWKRNSAPEEVGINGEIQFLNLNGDILHRFNPDFGQELRLNFIVGSVP